MDGCLDSVGIGIQYLHLLFVRQQYIRLDWQSDWGQSGNPIFFGIHT